MSSSLVDARRERERSEIAVISIGDRLDGKYRVTRRLGGGGFGEVFLADDEMIPDRRVAIKALIRPQEGDLDDLLWEMQTLAQFNHPHVVTFYHHFKDEKRLYLVMEFCPAGSLYDRLRTAGRFPETQVFAWGLDLCETLAFVHKRGIVHHDIKPMNILFAGDATIKIGDFGVANRNIGTLPYMPPEMLLGERVSRIDPRVDIYALGLTLLESLIGTHPFEGMAPAEEIRARIAHDFVPLKLSRWVQEVLLRATHPTPELRFQTMADFAEAIQGKSVPYIFDGNRIKAHAFAQKAEAMISRKKWKSAEKFVACALLLSPDCVAALMAAGRCQLLIRRLDKAKEYFSKAASISPRTHVQKELGWLSLEEGHLPAAISLLTDHLQRNSSDYEAYNLLLKCFYLSDRFEAGEELAGILMGENAANDCFRNNLALCRLLNGGFALDELDTFVSENHTNPFIAYNLAIGKERWNDNGPPYLKSKLIFEEYRTGLACRSGRRNVLGVDTPDGDCYEISQPIVTIGSQPTNDIVLRDGSVSRRHAVITNFPNEVWIHDLGSTCGTEIDGRSLEGRTFLDGVHDVRISHLTLRVAASADQLA